MKMARFLFLLLTIWSLVGTAQADTSFSNLGLNPGLEDNEISDSGVPGPDSFSRTERAYYSDTPSSSDYSSPYQFVDNAYAGAVEMEGNPSGVPEPDTMMLLGFGLLALAGIGRRFTRT